MTHLQDQDIDALLAKKLAGETDSEEDRLIADWLGASENNRLYWSDLQKLWGLTPEVSQRAVDTEAALSKVKLHFKQASGGKGRTMSMSPWWMAAAAAMVLGVATWFFWQNNQAAETIVAGAKVQQSTLPDGSEVALNPGSELELQPAFGKKTRRLRLKGSARFDVATDSTQTFAVEVGALEVEVLGTIFTVDNLSNPDVVLVKVEEGRVALTTSQSRVVLQAGEAARYDVSSTEIFRLDQEQQAPSRNFKFNATPLGEVITSLELAYNVRIKVSNPALKNCTLQATYQNMELQDVLELIADAFSLEVRNENGVYLLVGDSCGE
ncbi:MAG: FecR domain-containing protein [Saprospiraceae bacterium]|nr:FecR domain-containing protein [Saprospiraceae bacterium]